jgi:hypothetical protein
MPEAQNYQNHGRIVPLFHYWVFLILLANVLWSGYGLVRMPGIGAGVGLLLGVGLILMALSLRGQILTVQDRVIRLEMRLRMRDLLPPDLAMRAAGLPVKQLVALRFASDAELEGLVRDVLEGRLETATAIKQAVKQWQGDYVRA